MTGRLTIFGLVGLLGLLACGSALGATINVPNLSYAAVSSAVAGAAVNDIVVLPAGTNGWTSALTLTRGITLRGAGRDSTELSRSGLLLAIAPTATAIANEEVIRVEGMSLNGDGSTSPIITVTGAEATSSKAWAYLVIGRCRIKNVSTVSPGAIDLTGQQRGLIYSNIFDRCGLLVKNMGNDYHVDLGGGKVDVPEWSSGNFPQSFGTADTLYFEGNTVLFSSSFDNLNAGWLETGHGARTAARYNRWDMSNAAASQGSPELWDIHGFQYRDPSKPGNGQIGTMVSEYYGNTIVDAVSSAQIHLRGGWALIFDNTLQNVPSWWSFPISSYEHSCSAEWNATNYVTEVTNAYIWNNYQDGTQADAWTGSDNFCAISEGVNYRNYGAGSIGRGTSTNDLPATCSPGEAFWVCPTATLSVDPSVVQQGVLYRCYTANTWTEYYTPYTFPHPLQTEGGTENDPPSIMTPPSNRTVTQGADTTFTVTAAGTAPLSYQWTLDGADVSGATTASLALEALTTNDAGSYRVVVTNAVGSVTSAAGVLTVRVLPWISAQPQAAAVLAGGSTNFTVIGHGLPAPAYYWRFNGAKIAGATATSYTVSSADYTKAGAYSVIVSNAAGSVLSDDAALTVNYPPIVAQDPVSLTNYAGSNAVFYVSVSTNSTPPLSYRWTFDTTAIADETNASLTLTDLEAADAGSYAVVITNLYGSVTSAAAVLTVEEAATNQAPIFTLQPVTVAVNEGGSATLTAAAFGVPAPTYQWRFNGADVAGATGTALTIDPAQVSDQGRYRVGVTNSEGGLLSEEAWLLVNTAPEIDEDPLGATINAGQSHIFSVSLTTGTEPLTYQWTHAGTNIYAGANVDQYQVDNAGAADAGSYTVVIGNLVGSVTSAVAVLAVTLPPSITAQPEAVAATAGDSATFTVTATGTAPLGYQWRHWDAPLAYATESSYTLLSVKSADAGFYSVIVTNAAGSATSSPALLTVAEAVAAAAPDYRRVGVFQ